ncbi:MAG: hypothetical protein JXA96_09130 [Sedimentisphaerales bacterium]|nr:hypothetical protein [Sedimentisphaerales bacterium]
MKSENNIPKYDLAKQIMAGQRKFAATKRIAPSRNRIRDKNSNEELKISKSTQSEPSRDFIQTNHSEERNTQPAIFDMNSPDQIISQIVARDIQNFCKR